MKRNLFLTTLSLGITSAIFVAATAVAADDDSKPSSSTPPSISGQGATGKSGSSTSGQSQKFMRASQLSRQQVKSTSGETLGQINDLVVDPATGRIEFAVLSLNTAEQRGKLTAVPWTLIRPSGQGQELTANIDKEKLSTAQTFDRSQWPHMSQENFGQQIYSHYGLQWQDRSSAGAGGGVSIGGSVGGADVGIGVSTNRSGIKGTDADNGTAPDGKGTFKSDRPGASDSTSPESKDKKQDSGLK